MNSLTFPILHFLADGRFHSGETIAKHFGVTRATVWNALRDAEQLGVELFSVRGRGYRFPAPVHFIDVAQVEQFLAARDCVFAMELYPCLPSTNSHLMSTLAAGSRHRVCAVAELQTAGRGRRGRVWQSALGQGLAFSVLWQFNRGTSALSGLSLAVGVALVRALRELGVEGVTLKWPNDLLRERRKLAGILIELQGPVDGPNSAVIGVGLNVAPARDLLRTIDQPATGMQDASGEVPDRNQVLGTLLWHMSRVLETFERNGFDAVLEEWQSCHALHGEEVSLHLPDGEKIIGVVDGVAQDGALLLRTETGMQRFQSGEISLRGVAT